MIETPHLETSNHIFFNLRSNSTHVYPSRSIHYYENGIVTHNQWHVLGTLLSFLFICLHLFSATFLYYSEQVICGWTDPRKTKTKSTQNQTLQLMIWVWGLNTQILVRLWTPGVQEGLESIPILPPPPPMDKRTGGWFSLDVPHCMVLSSNQGKIRQRTNTSLFDLHVSLYLHSNSIRRGRQRSAILTIAPRTLPQVPQHGSASERRRERRGGQLTGCLHNIEVRSHSLQSLLTCMVLLLQQWGWG